MNTEKDHCILANRKHIIYLLTNIDNGSYYVGKTCQTLDKRWRQHLDVNKAKTVEGKYKSETYLSRSMRKHGSEKFLMEELSISDSLESSNSAEKLWIAALRSYDPSIGYNGTYGGDGVCPTKESLLKQIKSLEGKRPRGSKHHMFGKTPSEETKGKISASCKGRTSPSRRTDLDWQSIKKEYECGDSSFYLARKYRCNKSTILNILKSLGCPRRDKATATKLGMHAAGYNA